MKKITKYYSDLLEKEFDVEEELVKAENDYKARQIEKAKAEEELQKRKEQRTADAKEIDDLIKQKTELEKKISDKIKEFNKKYNSGFHLTIRDGLPFFSTFFDTFFNL